MSKKESNSSRPDGEFIEPPRPRYPTISPQRKQGSLSKKVWGATADEILLDGVDLITELMHSWESGGPRVFRCEHERYVNDSSSEDEYEDLRQMSGAKK